MSIVKKIARRLIWSFTQLFASPRIVFIRNLRQACRRQKRNGGLRILLTSHELSETGAVLMLYRAVRILKEQGYFCWVIANNGGPMQDVLASEGVSVFVDPHLYQNSKFVGSCRGCFDLILANTILSLPVLVANPSVPGVLWVHESLYLQHYFTTARPDLLGAFAKLKNVLIPSLYAKKTALPYKTNIEVLYCGIEDVRGRVSKKTPADSNVMRFCLVGTLEPRKGQDIFVEAIKRLPADLRSLAQFSLIGPPGNGVDEFVQGLQAQCANTPEIVFVGPLSHDPCIEQIAAHDVLVCASRDESFSLTVAEALSIGLATIVSTSTGVAELLVQGESSLLFESEDVAQLASLMEQLIRDRSLRRQLGEQGRKVYETRLTEQKFKESFLDNIEPVLHLIQRSR